jgi:hypothetical protein
MNGVSATVRWRLRLIGGAGQAGRPAAGLVAARVGRHPAGPHGLASFLLERHDVIITRNGTAAADQHIIPTIEKSHA